MIDWKAERRWLIWRMRDTRKVPCDAQGNNLDRWSEPESWLTYTEAQALLRALPFPAVSSDGKRNAGLGRVDGDGWAHVDIDHCQDDDPFLALLRGTGAYVERSPSRTGWHCVGRGGRSIEVTYKGGNGGAFKDLGRFLTVTGIDAEGDPNVGIDMTLAAIAGHFAGAAKTAAPAPKPALPEVIRPGTQNQELFREACRHIREGKTEDEVYGILNAIKGRAPAEPGAAPWTERDLRLIARSASRYKPSDDPFPTTEGGDGEFFARLHAEAVRFDFRRARWLVWDGVRWRPDPIEKVSEFALQSARTRQAAALKVEDGEIRKGRLKWAIGGESEKRISCTLASAARKPPLVSAGDEWDTNPWLLGVPNGVVDLKTGILRDGRPDDLITMQAAIPFDSSATCPLWEATLADIFKDHAELIPYIQRALGYSLTGDCRHEIFFLLTGQTGRNGKGTVINTVSKILGDYADDLGFHSLEISAHGADSGATPDLAKLDRKRFVTASETSGGRFNEARIKKMTGRDPVTCRFLHQNEFTYTPEFKMWLSVNDLPRVRDDSLAFWSRPHRIPFLQCYAGREDLTLKDRLFAEGAGILAWLVRGCLAWQTGGLSAPACVTEAVADYRRSQEPLAEFLHEETVEDKNADVPMADLLGRYRGWCDEKRAFRRLGRNAFYTEIRARFSVEETGHAKILTVFGLRLASAEGEELMT